ncbi:unnamed protein product, partial [Polarella glacialis]
AAQHSAASDRDRGRFVPTRPHLDCGREWTRPGAPLRCRLRVPNAGGTEARTRPAVASVCGQASGCRRHNFV